MKKLRNAFMLAGGMAMALLTQSAGAQARADALGWKLGAQAWTFNHFTLAEALEKMDSCGIQFVEAYPGQVIGGGIEGKMDYHMPPAKQEQVKSLFKKKHKVLMAFGVVVPDSEADWRALFDFANRMGIQVITSEPQAEYLDLISSLCDQYNIKLAIHDHPNPSPYWSPESVLKAVEGRSKLMGACADIGHWVRSGLDPVECLKKLNGRVISLHMKDLNNKTADSHDLVWGNGVCQISKVLETLKNQKFKGLFSAEYEYKWDYNVPEVKASAAFWRQMVTNL
ncbi:sugar phosphate isomerase/epimerase family protein [Chitinophaga nivalis]|uniref:Sugar phosphate isomerase/epimerase n=1 Tax=Chitinophaga nivalis TaxID=2991709 RepID=A0ABT3INR2_9BACT|nr:sugar phosphate isomerase/epimerase [Chitinophaga nivalis]MCW3464731.1 sugar phosphate isomerase/epimerase [Chitinophaga nivalis]MCW3485578.1 sugar phosphate isomerase/epimerase [Chitinophaga nivalis]